MNAIPAPAHPSHRAILVARLVAVLLISIGAGAYVWMRPLPPTWEFPSSARFISVIGVTRDGRVVSLVFPKNEMLPARLCVQDAETGRVMADHLTSDSIYRRGVLTGDGEWVILDSAGMSQVQVVSLKDGTLRYPTFYARGVDVSSADGRFAVMESAERDNYEDYIVDLITGEFQWKCGEETMFSSDSQRYLTIRRDQGQHFVSVRSLVDNQELLSDIIPDIAGGRYNWLQRWSGDRVYISYDFKVTGSIFGERRCWSYDTRGTRLSDPQFDPTIHSQLINARTYSHQFFRKEYGGDLRLHFPPPEGSILFRIQDTLIGLEPPVRVRRFRILLAAVFQCDDASPRRSNWGTSARLQDLAGRSLAGGWRRPTAGLATPRHARLVPLVSNDSRRNSAVGTHANPSSRQARAAQP